LNHRREPRVTAGRHQGGGPPGLPLLSKPLLSARFRKRPFELIRDFQNKQIDPDPAWRQRRMLSGSKRQRDSGPALGQFQERYTVAAEDLSRYVEKSTA
jgi:hypothetical protein